MINLPNKITKALEKKQTKVGVPSNLFDMERKDIEALGYVQLSPKKEIEDGDLLDVAEGNLWGVVLNAKDYRKSIYRSEVRELIILRK